MHLFDRTERNLPAPLAFLEGESFEDVIRTAVSYSGDCDTLTCIAGSIAESFYGVLKNLKEECRNRLPTEQKVVLDQFDVSGQGDYVLGVCGL